MNLPDSPGFLTFAFVFRDQTTVRNALSPGEKCGRAASAQFPPFLRVSGTLRREPPFSNPPTTNQNKICATQSKTRNPRIDLDITAEARSRFAAIHKALGFKTKTETFEALVFSISAKGCR
jgi:hypothetical protein